jgi:hypothetical protein
MESLKIIDLNGEELVVVDLKAAMEQANRFRRYRHVDKSFKQFDKKQRAYWEDVYNKLLLVKDIVHFN